MSKTLPPRRLVFDHLPQIRDDVQTLHTRGCTALGAWDLAQTCGHLNDWMRFPMDGFPRASLPMRMMMAGLRVTVGRRLLKKILAERSMRRGAPTLPITVPAAGRDPTTAVETLLATIDRLSSHHGPTHPSPLFGCMDHETLVRLQLVHCAHHLSLLIPRE